MNQPRKVRTHRTGWPLEEELAREPGLALVPLTITLLEYGEVEVPILTLLDGDVEVSKVIAGECNANRAK